VQKISNYIKRGELKVYKIAIVEDELEYRQQVSEYILQYGEENGMHFEIEAFQDGREIMDADSRTFDIIFFDIEMPKVNGMDASKYIRERDENVVIVFITNLSQYAIQGYSVGAVDFVLKPINYYSFSLRLNRALSRVKKKETTDVIITTADGMKRLDTGDVFFVEIANRMLHYHTKHGEYVVRGTLQSAEAALTEYHFVKCNYWYLINLKYVSEIQKNMVFVADRKLEISRRNKAAFVKAVTDYIGGGV
jgi:DNA-binding LytR/AlgR family response regulator